jgi:hypothetical protein
MGRAGPDFGRLLPVRARWHNVCISARQRIHVIDVAGAPSQGGDGPPGEAKKKLMRIDAHARPKSQ